MARKSSSRRVSSPKMVKVASKVLRSSGSSKISKSLAGSVLSQAKSKRK
ncbi:MULTISPECIES: hypothetical protein [Bacillus]|nr:hypothetical protein [Bacillus sonorensis]